ncbi:MAG TPA: MerR family transcriptional regulator [Acidimicrobiales bacterium]|nr:MerR family transcriptional regulator [Acidimicrobiales bacterium]
MAARTHLSIGEVLSLLREEFPDVTISKIRFLESQGLVDPERTPSGYRKFYDHDVERLRWILRQQRENFLPLKVIRGRLEEHGDESAVEELGQLPLGGDPDEAVAAAPEPAVAERRPGPSPSPAVEEAGASDAGPTDPVVAPAVADPPEEAPPVAAVRPTDASPPASASPPGSSRPASTPVPAVSAAAPTAPPAPSAPPPVAAPASPATQPAAATAARAPQTTRAATGAPAKPADDRPDPGTDVDSYTLAELARAAGATDSDVAALRDFGLIAPDGGVGGTAYYGPDALEVVEVATTFARHGVEARHLRAWKTSADREVALFEQVIMPLLRQRNPQARRQAADTVATLADAGARLRAALVRRGVDDLR